jgi:hypothetical protein
MGASLGSPRDEPRRSASPAQTSPKAFGFDAVLVHKDLKLARIDVNVQLTQGIYKSIVTEFRVPLVKPFYLRANPPVDGVVSP